MDTTEVKRVQREQNGETLGFLSVVSLEDQLLLTVRLGVLFKTGAANTPF